MAMLILPDVFERTWGHKTEPFWPGTTARVREKFPGFTFMTEVYWDLAWTMTQQGFDYAYDKRLYDRLREGHARPVREHLWAGLDFHSTVARFLGNHDEPQAAATFAAGPHEAAAVITFLSPGLRFFHQGQFEGRSKRISPHLVRGGRNSPIHRGNGSTRVSWQCSSNRRCGKASGPCSTACPPGMATGRGTTSWPGPGHAKDGHRLLITVNYAGHQSQCYARPLFGDPAGRRVRLKDLMSAASYDRDGIELGSRGLFLDLPPWGYHVFDVSAV